MKENKVTIHSKDNINLYLNGIASNPRNGLIPSKYPDVVTKSIVAENIISTIWQEGSFCMSDIKTTAYWEGSEDTEVLKCSIKTARQYISSLGLRLEEFNTKPSDNFRINFKAQPSQKEYSRRCPEQISDNTKSWIIYIPFDTCDFNLGGSRWNELIETGSYRCPNISNSTYFMDCYEVVRELVEDKIVKTGVTVGEGGLIVALWKMVKNNGLDVDLSGIMKSYSEKDIIKILFSEIPGVVIEIDNFDFDYVDAELVLQGVAYYPIGHPAKKGLRIENYSLPDLSDIMLSLLGRQNPEGED